LGLTKTLTASRALEEGLGFEGKLGMALERGGTEEKQPEGIA